MKQVIATEKIPIKLWLDNIENGALKQAKNLANLFFARKWIALMPDCHQGYGMPIGGILATDDIIVPNAVGVDIGCGMIATKLSLTEINHDLVKIIIDDIKNTIPVGFKHNEEDQFWLGFDFAPDLSIIQQELKSARKQLGTLGGGNHFIEIQYGSDGHVWVMIHSGSRNIGLKVAKEYHSKAVDICERWNSDIPTRDLAFLPMESQYGQDYYKAMNFCFRFAHANRRLMMKKVIAIIQDRISTNIEHTLNISHNYAAIENHFGKEMLIHRKGATRALKGQYGIIPGSMGTNSYIVEGTGNPLSFMSCSHGAGRKMGRNEAKKKLNLEEEQRKMQGIVNNLNSVKRLDEAPGAYKNIETVMKDQEDLVKTKVILTPLGVVKG